MNLIQVPHRVGLCHERSNAFIEGTINNQIGTGTFRPTFLLKRRPFAKNSRRIEIKVTVPYWSSVLCALWTEQRQTKNLI